MHFIPLLCAHSTSKILSPIITTSSGAGFPILSSTYLISTVLSSRFPSKSAPPIKSKYLSTLNSFKISRQKNSGFALASTTCLPEFLRSLTSSAIPSYITFSLHPVFLYRFRYVSSISSRSFSSLAYFEKLMRNEGPIKLFNVSYGTSFPFERNARSALFMIPSELSDTVPSRSNNTYRTFFKLSSIAVIQINSP